MLTCDLCGLEADRFFLRRVRAEGWKWGFKDVWSCWRCVDVPLQIKEILEGQGCLNSMEVCRILNGFEREDFKGCYANNTFGVTRPERCNHEERGCHFWSFTVYKALHKLEDKGLIQSTKRRFWDRTPMRTDIFRFWFVSEEAYTQRIVVQTMDGYVSPRA